MTKKCADGGDCGIGGFCAPCPMSKDLPDWVEKWIAEHQFDVERDNASDVINAKDLRALLSQHRLCEREAVKYLVSPDNHELPLPLYAEAKEGFDNASAS